jgi:hypothetical protein
MELVPVLRRPDRGCGTVRIHQLADDREPVRRAASIASASIALELDLLAGRHSVELYFNCCLVCRAVPISRCTCHDEGKGTG